MKTREIPVVAITMGYPAGVSPELIVKSLSKGKIRGVCRAVVLGDMLVLDKASELSGVPIKWNLIGDTEQAEFKSSSIDLVDFRNVSFEDFEWGKVLLSLGRASGEYLEAAWRAAEDRKVDGIVSGVLSKEALNKGGYPCQDELELFSRITDSPEPFLVGVTGGLWTIPVTTHLPFREIHQKITKDKVLSHIIAIDQLMRQCGFVKPRIAVTALNVHAGEGGLFGDEEATAITPAIVEAQRLGIDASGPYAADTVFVRARKGQFDSIVGMYHDQVNIGRKLIDDLEGVTLFAGLPVPCGTPAHGTAFDIAGRGVADSSSMEMAIEIVARLSSVMRRY